MPFRFLTVCAAARAGSLFGRTAGYLPRASRIFEKETFGSLELARYLADGGYDEVELCGLVSNICVVSNALLAKAALPEARVVVCKDATASADAAAHEAALSVMRSVFCEVL